MACQTISTSASKYRDVYRLKPGAPLFQEEFGYYCLDEWRQQGLAEDANLQSLFGYDEPACFHFQKLGGCEAAFAPGFEEKIIEDRGSHELVQDAFGRHVLCFKGRRSGFMPEYINHPVKDIQSWEENCKWRMDPNSPERFSNITELTQSAREAWSEGKFISQLVVGGYMYLRSLIGPLELMYKLVEAPALIHECMKQWLVLADAIITRHQEIVPLEELFFSEDICYNKGLLVSPDMIREFLFPYYQQLITNIKSRQPQQNGKLHFHVDCDGFCEPAINLYREIGMDAMSPFEVASGCDVVELGRKYPWLIMPRGGVDKRILAKSKDDIDRMVDRVFPAMQARGGYIPTCDHGVPAEVSLENYLHYRKRCAEFG